MICKHVSLNLADKQNLDMLRLPCHMYLSWRHSPTARFCNKLMLWDARAKSCDNKEPSASKAADTGKREGTTIAAATTSIIAQHQPLSPRRTALFSSSENHFDWDLGKIEIHTSSASFSFSRSYHPPRQSLASHKIPQARRPTRNPNDKPAR